MKAKEGHKKGKQVKYRKLEIQRYLISDKITVKEAKLLFKIRTEMIDVRENYKNKYVKKQNDAKSNEKALLCQLCKNHADSAENVFKCSALNDRDEDKNIFKNLFSDNMDGVSSTIKEFSSLWRKRQQLLIQN